MRSDPVEIPQKKGTSSHRDEQFALQEAVPRVLRIEFVVFVQENGPSISRHRNITASEAFSNPR